MTRIIGSELTLNVPSPDKEKKLVKFLFSRFSVVPQKVLCASKGFMKAFKAFIKPFETPQRSVKEKFNLIFISMQLSENARDGKG